MLTLPPSVRVYLCTQPTDMRKSFPGLVAATRSIVQQDPLSGHLFVFMNRRGNLVKVLFWDGSGFCILAKKLGRGRFRFPREAGEDEMQIEIESAELAMMLEGFDVSTAKRTPRWEPRKISKKVSFNAQNPLTADPR
jgi:transposase